MSQFQRQLFKAGKVFGDFIAPECLQRNFKLRKLLQQFLKELLTPFSWRWLINLECHAEPTFSLMKLILLAVNCFLKLFSSQQINAKFILQTKEKQTAPHTNATQYFSLKGNTL